MSMKAGGNRSKPGGGSTAGAAASGAGGSGGGRQNLGRSVTFKRSVSQIITQQQGVNVVDFQDVCTVPSNGSSFKS